MNAIEREMVALLAELKERYCAVGVKAEFEAEGVRTEELVRLKEICLASNMSLTLKIGGCEALRDMYDARSIGVDYLVAPMVETDFSLHKYLRSIDLVFPKDERREIEYLVNIETILAVRNFPKMLKLPEIKKLNGIVIGRVDLVGSMGRDRKAVNEEEIFQITRDLLTQAKAKKLKCVIGGAISVESLPFLHKLPSGLLDRYETRKVCFQCPQGLGANAKEGIQKAVWFELLWLRNKRDYYKNISVEDEKRIIMLEARFKRREDEK